MGKSFTTRMGLIMTEIQTFCSKSFRELRAQCFSPAHAQDVNTSVQKGLESEKVKVQTSR